MSLTYEKATYGETAIGSSVSVISWAFISAEGAASEETEKVTGIVKRVVTNPDGEVAPTANWDLVIEDEDGVDILAAGGADRDPTGAKVSEQIIPSAPPVVASKLTFKVTNAGNAKKAVVKAYII